MKRIILGLVLLFISFILIACEKSDELLRIELDTSAISEGIKKDDFHFDLVKIKLIYESKESIIPLTKDYIENFSDEMLEPGMHNITVNYQNKKATFFLNIKDEKEEIKEDVYYNVSFVGMNDVLIETLRIKENDYVLDPITAPTVEGYKFISWSESFPLIVTSDITVKATYEEIKVDLIKPAINYLRDYFSEIDEVDSDIELPLNYEGVDISWVSSDEESISSAGKYHKDYESKNVIITATLTDGEKTVEKNFYLKAKGYKSLKAPIASTYLYRNYDKLTDEFFSTMDIVYCAFVTLDDGGNYKVNNALNNMTRYVIPRCQKEGIYVIPSIGGGGSDAAKRFSAIAADATLRKNFVSSMVKLINTYGFDGVDIDWEAPTSSEKENFTLLMKELNEAVKGNNPHHLVTAAIGGGKWYPPRYDLTNSIKYMDYVNMMLYSMCSSSGQYQNALYKSQSKNDTTNGCGYTLTSCSFEESLEIYNSYGVPNSKLILGLAFYAQKQTKENGEYKGSGSVLYTNLKANYINNSNYKYVFDEKAGVPYLISLDGNTFISYDDARSIKAKAAYVIETGCGGLMTWEWGCDLTGELGQAMKEGLGK